MPASSAVRSRAAVVLLLGVTLAAAAWGGWTEASYHLERQISEWPVRMLAGMLGVPYALAGAMLLWRRAADRVGWLLLLFGVTMQLARTETSLAMLREPTSGDAIDVWEQRPFGPPLTALVTVVTLVVLGLLPYLVATAPRRYRWHPVLVRGAPVVLAAGSLLLTVQFMASSIDATWDSPIEGGTMDQPAWIVWGPAVVYLVGLLTCWVLLLARLVRGPRRGCPALVLLAGAVALVPQWSGSEVLVLLGLTAAPFLVLLARLRDVRTRRRRERPATSAARSR
ncbi:hypothetical protein [Georgenia alba]|uniref:Uncharacterized protein n=1 Tax=Georgenia alba TaxID=2233858 RepID=A0ABW2Q4R9_9MICO